MFCKSPLPMREGGRIAKDATFASFFVPCGWCAYCRSRRRREWVNRLTCQLDSTPDSCFLTLTYNDESIPLGSSLEPKHLTLFWKRVRKRLKNIKIKYYACGEYGDDSERPHYHAIVFGLKNENFSRFLFDVEWPYGYVYLLPNGPKQMAYVCQYLDKKKYKDYGLQWLDGRENVFSRQSTKLGLEYLLNNIDQVSKAMFLQINENKVSLPRYFVKQLRKNLGEDWYLNYINKAKERSSEENKKLFDKAVPYRELNWSERREFLDMQRNGAEAMDLNLRTRAKLFNKKVKI